MSELPPRVSVIARPVANPDPGFRGAPQRPPGIPGVIGVFLLAPLAMLVLQFMAGVIVGVIFGASGSVAEAAQFFETPSGIIVILISNQAAILIVLWGAMRRCPLSQSEQLGLGRPALSPLAYAVLVVGAVFAAIVGALLFMPLVLSIRPALDFPAIRRGLDSSTLIPFLLAISAGPGLVEELFFRGYIQRRLLRRLRPTWAVALSSLLFALLHWDLIHFLFAFPVGVWLGVIAWRTGSVWPGVACHVCLNLAWNLWFMLVEKALVAPLTEVLVIWTVPPVALLGFIAGIFILREQPAPRPAGPSAFDPPAPPSALMARPREIAESRGHEDATEQDPAGRSNGSNLPESCGR